MRPTKRPSPTYTPMLSPMLRPIGVLSSALVQEASQPSQERPDSDQPRLAQGQPTSRERPLTDHYPPQASPLQWTPHTPLISDNKLMMVIGIMIGTAIKVKPRLGVLLLLYRFKSKFICPASTHTCVYLATPVMLQQAFREKATVANFAADSSSHPSER